MPASPCQGPTESPSAVPRPSQIKQTSDPVCRVGRRPPRRYRSSSAARRRRFCLLPTEPPLAVLRCVVSPSQLHLGMTPSFTVEKTRSYSFGICGVVTSVPSSATSTILQEHFAPLRRFLAFMQIAADSPHAFKFRAGYRVSGGRTGRSPCLTSTLE